MVVSVLNKQPIQDVQKCKCTHKSQQQLNNLHASPAKCGIHIYISLSMKLGMRGVGSLGASFSHQLVRKT